MSIYLINKQDKWCPENNNGDYILEAYSSLGQAQARAKQLDEEETLSVHLVLECPLDAHNPNFFLREC